MTKKSLRDFDPVTVADLETRMWQAYYSHHFIRLFFLVVRLVHEFFGASVGSALRAAYHSARAATVFRKTKGHEDTESVLESLVLFYDLIARNSTETFDVRRAAEHEMLWWFVDRYPERYEISRQDALAQAAGTVYGIDPSWLGDYAARRAEAMMLQDAAELTGVPTDWNRAKSLLVDSFRALKQAIDQ